MNVYQRAIVILAVTALLICANMRSVSSAADGQPFGPVLGGVKSVYVRVEPVSPETQQKGMAAAQLRKDTEQQLSKAGIKLLSEREFNNFRLTGSYPLARLDVSVTIDELNVGGTTLNVNLIVVTARQQAFLGRKPAIRFFATTWQRQEISYTNDLAHVYEVLRGLVDEFISAYNSANR